jgi:hypothetical protein
MNAGYSGTPLPKKLGIKPGQAVVAVAAPETYGAALGDLPDDAQITYYAAGDPLPGACALIHYFTTRCDDFTQDFPALRDALASDGALWISWPKGSSKVPTDLNENIIREFGLENGLVDVKVCAVDSIWSGLKFVYRLVDR